MTDGDKKITLLIKYLDIQLLQQKALCDKFDPKLMSDYARGCIDTLEIVMIAANSIKNEFRDDAAENLRLKEQLKNE